MPANLQISSLIPVGLIADNVTQVGDAILVTVRARARMAMYQHSSMHESSSIASMS